MPCLLTCRLMSAYLETANLRARGWQVATQNTLQMLVIRLQSRQLSPTALFELSSYAPASLQPSAESLLLLTATFPVPAFSQHLMHTYAQTQASSCTVLTQLGREAKLMLAAAERLLWAHWLRALGEALQRPHRGVSAQDDRSL